MATATNVTFALHIDNKPNRFGRYVIYVRVTKDRKKRLIKTPVEVANKSFFNRNAKYENWIRQSDLEFTKKNEILAKALSDAKLAYSDILSDGQAVTLYGIADKVQKEPTSSSLMLFFKEHNDNLHANGQIRYWKQFNDVYNKLEAFRKRQRMGDILFSDLTVRFLDKFVSYLSKIPNQRDPNKVLHNNTIQNVLKRFRSLINKAVRLGYISYGDDPFNNYKFKWTDTNKDRLDKDEIDTLANLNLEKDSLLWHTRNCFLFSYYCAGTRPGDLLQLRWCNIKGNRLSYRMGKNHKASNVLLMPQALEILDLYRNESQQPNDYIFPFLDNSQPYAKAVTQEQRDTMKVELKTALFKAISNKNALINKKLKQLAKIANIDKHITLYVSRHSFAKQAVLTKDVKSTAVKGLLAHSSLKTTENYLGKFDTSVEDEAMLKIFGHDDETQKMQTMLANMTDEQKELLRSLLDKK